MTHPRRIAIVARHAEAFALAFGAGLLVWGLRRFVLELPIVWMLFLGLLAGGAATQPTLGHAIRHRTRRGALAVACALLASGVVTTGDYLGFRDDQMRRHHASDHRLDQMELEARVDAELIRLTGHGGPVGYGLAALQLGRSLFGVTVSGVALLGLWLGELGLALYVAWRWAAGPAAAATPAAEP